MRWIVLALCGFFLSSTAAFGWGNAGHMTVCQIAYLNLTPVAKAEVDRLLPKFRSFSSFAESCTHPDNPPILDDDHYVNYPRTLAHVTDGGCGTNAQSICVLSALRDNLAILGRRADGDRARAESLFLVGHWVGDIHQPLHASFEDDRGGGSISVSGPPCVMTRASERIARAFINLHKVWDRCILEVYVFRTSMGFPEVDAHNRLQYVRQAADILNRRISAGDRASWLQAAEPWRWAAESYELAIRPEVGYCIRRSGACWYSQSEQSFSGTKRPITIDNAYLQRFAPDIERRIQMAGIRLAHQLNMTLDPAYRASHS